MSQTIPPYDFTTQLKAAKAFFDRSTKVLEEADSNYRPQDALMTVAQQVAHTAQTISWFVDGATRPEGFDLNFEAFVKEVNAITSLAAARQKLDAAFAGAIEFVAKSSPEQLAAPLPAGPVMGGQPISDIIWAIVEHTAHHRGALTMYSRLLGKVPPMPYGDCE